MTIKNYMASRYYLLPLSGSRATNRPGLQAALREVCAANGALVVYSLSRVARSVRDTLDIAGRLEKAGADLVSLSEHIDTTSAAGKMMFRMLAVLAEFERDLVSERTVAAMQHKRGRRERISRYLPFGYDLGDNGRTLVPNTREQAVLLDIRALREKGTSFRAIADELKRRGFLTKAGKPDWTHTAVRSILQRAA